MPNKEAVEVILELRMFRDDIDGIMNAIGDKASISQEEKELLREKLKSLKSKLKDATKRATHNNFQHDYLEPAVRSASANLLIAINSDPIKANWFSALYGIRIDFAHSLHQLESQFPDI